MSNVFERARAIRMVGEPWQNAVQRAGSQLRYESMVGGAAGRKTAAPKAATTPKAAKATKAPKKPKAGAKGRGAVTKPPYTRTSKTGKSHQVKGHKARKYSTEHGNPSKGHLQHLNALHKTNHAKRVKANECEKHRQIDCSYRQKSGRCALTAYSKTPEWEHRDSHDAYWAVNAPDHQWTAADVADEGFQARQEEGLAAYRDATHGDKKHAREARAHHRAEKAANKQAARLEKQDRRVDHDKHGQYGGQVGGAKHKMSAHERGKLGAEARPTILGADGELYRSNFNCQYNKGTARCNIRKGCKPHKTADGKATQAALKTVRSQIARKPSSYNAAVAQFADEEREAERKHGKEFLNKASHAIQANPEHYGMVAGWKPGHKKAAASRAASRAASPKARKGGSYNAYGGRNWDGFSDTSSTRSSDFTSVSDTTSFTASTDSSSMW